MTQESQAIQHEAAHPTPGTYFKIAMVLSILTAIEVGIFYLEFLSYGIIPILVLLSGAKFILVCMYYMHLKFDDRIFSTMFVAGLITAAGVTLALMTLFSFFA
jgi:cytochrome c oxidase subunit 4|tara:strand:+ start:612 stop:920 length:309 start_codon:yes stop_codon:yes gene_type:complete